MEEDKNKEFAVPTESTMDFIHSLGKSFISLVPGTGPILSTFYENILTPPLKRRQFNWMKRIVESLTNLEEKIEDFKIENLRKNEEFISLFIEISPIAIKTHQEEKLKYLNNFLIKSIRNKSPFDYKKKLLSLVDTLYLDDISILYHLERFKHLVKKSRKKKYKKYEKTRSILRESSSISYSFRSFGALYKPIFLDEFASYLLEEEIEEDMFFMMEGGNIERLEEYKMLNKESLAIGHRGYDTPGRQQDCVEVTKLGLDFLEYVLEDYPNCILRQK